MSREKRCVRDIIDDVMVSLDMLEGDLARISAKTEAKGHIVRARDWIERMRDLLVELKTVSEELGDCREPVKPSRR